MLIVIKVYYLSCRIIATLMEMINSHYFNISFFDLNSISFVQNYTCGKPYKRIKVSKCSN